MIKAAILVLADVQTHGDLGRVYNALVAAGEFKEAGDAVRIIFDGAATQWPGILSATDHPAHAAYNAVDEVDAVRVPVGPENPYGNAFTRKATRIRRESKGAPTADGSVGRTWHVVNPGRRNRMGRPVGYALIPEGQPTLLADPSSSIAKRAAFTTRHLWITEQDDAERYPSGQYVNQNPGSIGIDTWVLADRDLDGQDLVLWHTFGLTHFPRPEDWPIMPVDHTGFVMKPVGFFDENPALDVPAPRSSHCNPAAAWTSENGSCH